MQLSVQELIVGNACPPGRFLRPGAGWAPMSLPVRVFVLHHPQRGAFLWDTGYGPAFWRATQRFPARVLRWLIPPRLEPDQHLTRQLGQPLAGLGLSHFHPDHVGSLPDLAEVPTWVSKDEWERVNRLGSFQALRTAHLKPLYAHLKPLFFEDLPSRIWSGLELLGPGWDWFGDGSARVFKLPGHTHGQLGLWMERAEGPLLAVGDAYYLPEQLDGVRLPAPTRWIVEDARAYARTLERLAQLRQLHPALTLRACHEPGPAGSS
ncbi:MBL fold metallo-hydrolase [bacterium]|nr:MBL fold metallo-hydrolase [bacterium]